LGSDADDAACVARCLAGDAAAFEVLVERYQRVMFNVALRMLGNYDDARDATQNCFVKAYQRLDSYDSRHRFFSWLYGVLKNECLNLRRARRPVEPVTPESAVATPSDGVESAEKRRAVQAALLTLPSMYREVIVLRHYAELSYEEMSAALGIPEKTVKSRLYTARQRLGELLLAWSTGP
jgi:RNA polymerase sigma-70 factor (ECF subfamily)